MTDRQKLLLFNLALHDDGGWVKFLEPFDIFTVRSLLMKELIETKDGEWLRLTDKGRDFMKEEKDENSA